MAKPTSASGSAHLQMRSIHAAAINLSAAQPNDDLSVGSEEPSFAVSMEVAIALALTLLVRVVVDPVETVDAAASSSATATLPPMTTSKLIMEADTEAVAARLVTPVMLPDLLLDLQKAPESHVQNLVASWMLVLTTGSTAS